MGITATQTWSGRPHKITVSSKLQVVFRLDQEKGGEGLMEQFSTAEQLRPSLASLSSKGVEEKIDTA